MTDLYMYLNYENQKKKEKQLFELLTELTHRLLKIETELKAIKNKLVKK
jgi:hypothetical protein